MSLLSGKIKQFLIKLKKLIFSPGLVSLKAKFNFFSEQANLDKKLVFSLAKSRWPNLRQLKYVKNYLNRGEKLIIGGCLMIIFFSSLFLGVKFYKTHLQVMPANGGDYLEGAVGSIKHVNPLYSSVSDIDNDLVSLIYSSLFRRGIDSGLVNDLAQSYQVSPDGKVYIIKIKPKAVWHGGGALTAADIIFTFQAIKNPDYKSPLRNSFSGVEIEKVDDYTVRFNLAEPYAAFLDLLTFGILPQELWQQIEPTAASLAELNLKPVGSGMYKFKSLIKDQAGNIRTYNLVRNNNYYEQPPFLNSISFKLYGSIEESVAALNSNLVNGLSYLPEQAKNQVAAQGSLNFYRLHLPKFSAVFFNAKSNLALADKKVRQALAHAIDKNKIIEQVMAREARPIDSPILPESFAYNPNAKKYNFDTASSSALLAQAGWKIVEITKADLDKAKQALSGKDEAAKNKARAMIDLGEGKWLGKNNSYLAIELTTVENSEYSQTAELIAKFWQAVNVKVKVNLIPASQIQTEVIRPRNFSALFYSEIAGADPDPYAFWHSSQIGQTGLNIADYANKEVDKLLEEGRLTNDLKTRQDKYKKFQEIIAEDEPAVFLYSPNYLYLQTKNIKGLNVRSIVLPNDRFSDANQWYVKTGKKIVW